MAEWFLQVQMKFILRITEWFQKMQAEFTLNFIAKDRWRLLLTGLGNTLLISLFAVLIGILIAVVVALVRSSWDTTNERLRPGFGKSVFSFFDRLCRLYITVIRGTPTVIQLMIMYYVIFTSTKDGVLVAIVSFGINSGAYVAEIIRGGIMSIEKGQMEAGRSLGLNYTKTMWYIIAPQVLKAILPALANEFIVLLKETSISGYVAVMDLTYAGNRIRGATYSAFMPLIAVAIIYLVVVVGLTRLVGILERRLRQSDGR